MNRVETLFSTPLRQLSDTCCSIIKNTRNIKRIIKSDNCKFILNNGLGDAATDDFCCWSLGTKWVKFMPSNGRLKWLTTNDCYSLEEMINDDQIDLESINKLVVYTYRELLDRLDPAATAVTVEDIMALADQKLRAQMNSDDEHYTVDFEFTLDDLL